MTDDLKDALIRGMGDRIEIQAILLAKAAEKVQAELAELKAQLLDYSRALQPFAAMASGPYAAVYEGMVGPVGVTVSYHACRVAKTVLDRYETAECEHDSEAGQETQTPGSPGPVPEKPLGG